MDDKMPSENLRPLRYRVLRYTPNLVRDEWINIGVMLEDGPRRLLRSRIIDEPGEFARVRRLHPHADEEWLRGLQREWDAQFSAPGLAPATVLDKLENSLSNLLQFSPARAVLAEDFDAELDRLYRDHVAPPPRTAGHAGLFANTRAWIRARVSDVFRRHHILGRMQKSVRVDEFTQAGDPFRMDYSYRRNGTHGYIHALSLARDPAQAKVLAYTFSAIRQRQPQSEFTAITEAPASRDNPRDQFVAKLFAESGMDLVALSQVEKFADDLRPRLN
jgi:hypothetical protein